MASPPKVLRIGDLVTLAAKGHVQQVATGGEGPGPSYSINLEPREGNTGRTHIWVEADEITWPVAGTPGKRAKNWWLLARLAELVERDEATIVSEGFQVNGLGEAQEYTFRVAAKKVVHDEAEAETAEYRAQIADLMSTRFAERAIAYGLDEKRQPTECPAENQCPTCKAGPRTWCRAVHNGERDSGGWTHPGRAMHDAERSFYERPLVRTRWPLVNSERANADTATGANLDAIARTVGLGRNGLTDQALRAETSKNVIITMRAVAADPTWIGRNVVLADNTTVRLHDIDEDRRIYGRVTSVNETGDLVTVVVPR